MRYLDPSHLKKAVQSGHISERAATVVLAKHMAAQRHPNQEYLAEREAIKHQLAGHHPGFNPVHVAQEALSAVGMGGLAHPIRRLHNPGGDEMFPFGGDGPSLVALLPKGLSREGAANWFMKRGISHAELVKQLEAESGKPLDVFEKSILRVHSPGAAASNVVGKAISKMGRGGMSGPKNLGDLQKLDQRNQMWNRFHHSNLKPMPNSEFDNNPRIKQMSTNIEKLKSLRDMLDQEKPGYAPGKGGRYVALESLQKGEHANWSTDLSGVVRHLVRNTPDKERIRTELDRLINEESRTLGGMAKSFNRFDHNNLKPMPEDMGGVPSPKRPRAVHPNAMKNIPINSDAHFLLDRRIDYSGGRNDIPDQHGDVVGELLRRVGPGGSRLPHIQNYSAQLKLLQSRYKTQEQRAFSEDPNIMELPGGRISGNRLEHLTNARLGMFRDMGPQQRPRGGYSIGEDLAKRVTPKEYHQEIDLKRQQLMKIPKRGPAKRGPHGPQDGPFRIGLQTFDENGYPAEYGYHADDLFHEIENKNDLQQSARREEIARANDEFPISAETMRMKKHPLRSTFRFMDSVLGTRMRPLNQYRITGNYRLHGGTRDYNYFPHTPHARATDMYAGQIPLEMIKRMMAKNAYLRRN